jgi:Tol biopolymer transport system component
MSVASSCVMLRHLVRIATGALLISLGASPARAQYFGQNLVQYKDFNYQVLKTDHFDIYFYPEERPGIDIAARLAERWNTRLERFFDHTLRGRQPLVMYASHVDFEQNTVIPGIGEGTGGVTEPLRRRIVLPFGGPLVDTDHVIGHELVHAFQFDITVRPGAAPGENGAERLPLWFIEGMAEYVTLGPVDPNTAMWVRDAAIHEKLPAIKDLNNPKYFPYRWGQAFWAYVGGRFGDEVIPRLLSLGGLTGDVDVAIERVLGVSSTQLSSDWQASIRAAYALPPGTSTASATGRAVLASTSGTNELNVGPAVSPDGRRVAFLSERSLLSIDLYVADTQSGRILHKLTSNATDPHYSSLQFIYSAGAWDTTGRQLAVATIVSGKPAIAIFDAERGHRTRDVTIDGISEVLNPTWAPDGQAIAFTGMSGGLTDLYVVDVNTSMLRRLTNDAYADLQPAWSPDGRRIAFATDRFSSQLDTLSLGRYRLAVIAASGGPAEEIRTFEQGNSFNPQWSADSRTMFFLSDRDGISNVFRIAVGTTGTPQRLTDVSTGVSGITASSPALSVAAQQGTAIVSVYDDGKYVLRSLDTAGEQTVTRARASDEVSAAVLPPADRRSSAVAAALADPSTGLPRTRTYPTEKYRPRLALEGIGQPTFGVGASQFGAAVGGGIAFLFSDMLNTHLLATAVQINQGISGSMTGRDIGAQAAYYNQAHRWNWGVTGGQVPYLSGGIQSGVAVSNGQLVGIEQSIVLRQTERSTSGIIAYPFDRARRLEFQGGLMHVSFDQVVQTTTFDPVTGRVFDQTTESTRLGQPLTMGTTTAAFVFDTTSFGATSPVAGQRFRIEAAPTFGSVRYTGVLADLRRYFMPAPFYTVATRVMHYGRYGAGGEDQRLFPLYLGYPTLVHGYDVNSFDPSECTGTATGSCDVIDRLTGSRLAVANLEFRFPLLRPFGASQRMYGPVPIEVGLFGDAGVAWARGQRPGFGEENRRGVSSAGIALRANLFGYAIGEIAFARPFQRPTRGWVWQFSLAPGW